MNSEAITGCRHSCSELQGLDDTTSEVAPVRATQSPVGPSNEAAVGKRGELMGMSKLRELTNCLKKCKALRNSLPGKKRASTSQE